MFYSRLTFQAAFVAATGLFLPAVCHASLSFMDYQSVGDHLIVYDPTANLEWLTLTDTLGESPSTALAANPGFSLATPDQVLTLFSDAGGGFTAYDGNNRNTNPDLATATAIYQFFGATNFANFGGGQSEAQLDGHVARPGSNPAVYDEYMVDLRTTFSFPGGAAEFISLGNCYQCSASLEANFLVRNAVPEPATMLLIGGGAVILGAARRRRRDVRA
jgi:PEP-CTERM motif-containing protein